MLFFVTGASGSGKTTCIPELRKQLPEYVIHDFDENEVPEEADTRWRQKTTEYWISKAIEYQHKGRDTIICGGAVYGEILASPSIDQIDRFAVCLLDCDDVLRIDRIHSRGGRVGMDMLAWSAWQRVHAVDPGWCPEVITKGGYSQMRWERWSSWQRGDRRWREPIFDTTNKKLKDIISTIVKWVHHETANEYPSAIESLEDDSREVHLSQDL